MGVGGYFWADAGAATRPTSRAIMRADIETVASFFIDLSRRISSSWRIDRAVTPTLARSGGQGNPRRTLHV